MTKESLKIKNDADLDFQLLQLKNKANSLSRDLATLVEKIEKQGIKASINSCGEIQSQALQIDLICARIGQLKDFKECMGE